MPTRVERWLWFWPTMRTAPSRPMRVASPGAPYSVPMTWSAVSSGCHTPFVSCQCAGLPTKCVMRSVALNAAVMP
jgi:hypothetical protein